jgi:hypothetical protein
MAIFKNDALICLLVQYGGCIGGGMEGRSDNLLCRFSLVGRTAMG